jgi:hypothetical protein
MMMWGNLRRRNWRTRARFAVLAAAVAGSLASGSAAGEGHLPFFHANRDWVLRRFEALERPEQTDLAPARAWSFDPFADESALARLHAARAAFDSAQTLADLGTFRATLDSVLAATLGAGARLDSLDRAFAAHLRTALEVTLGTPAGLEVERVEAWLDGTQVQQRALSDSERAALRAGGVLEVLRRVVEPRAQKLAVHVWSRGAAAPSRTDIVVDPEPDRLTVFHLDLADPSQPARFQRTALGD